MTPSAVSRKSAVAGLLVVAVLWKLAIWTFERDDWPRLPWRRERDPDLEADNDLEIPLPATTVTQAPPPPYKWPPPYEEHCEEA